MISDVLFEAVKAIREYQRDLPNAYEADRERIDRVVEVMDELRAYFDKVPSSDPQS